MKEQKQTIAAFLATQLLSVVATVDKSGKPESAVVAFSETPELELIFGTFMNTRKFANLGVNPAVAFVITEGDITVQYEGMARLVAGTEMEVCREMHLAKNSKSKKYAFHEDQRFFKVSPTWIRYSDFSVDPELMFEVRW